MILIEEARREATKHPHDTKFILRMRIRAARVENDVLNPTFASNHASSFIPRPEISVDERGMNARSATKMPVPQ